MPKPHKYHLIILLAAAVLCFGVGAQYGRNQQRSEQAAAALLLPLTQEEEPATNALPPVVEAAEEEELPPPLAVHVKGAVASPGLYELPPGSRVEAAVTAAGLLDAANTDIVNFAAPLADGMEIIIPFRVEGEETDWQVLAESSAVVSLSSGGEMVAATGPVNINSAGLASLQTLNGIGDAKAQAIIDYREQHGAFRRIEDIKKVSGIGEATFEKIRAHICVE